MDEIGLKPFPPYNIILAAKFGKETRGNISTCGSRDLGFLDIFILKGALHFWKSQVKVFKGFSFF